MSDTILLVDDDPHIVELSQMYLEQEGFTIASADNGKDALRMMLAVPPPALVVLDLMLPKMNGRDVCREVRKVSDVPIIMLTALSDDVDKIVGLELGADDYLTKPFNPRELVARVKAILRRIEKRTSATPPAPVVSVGNLTIVPHERVVRVGERTVELRMKEFDLLLLLAEHRGVVFSREKLLDIVWGYSFAGETRTVDVHVAHLRQKLEGMTATLETVWGVGYKLTVA
jgi:DNA-binding response OmpR family regulator